MSESQKRDDVSAKMGSLLMKGYKMLADSCPTCNNVLMQDKKGVNICVNCNESKPVAAGNNTVAEDDAQSKIVGHKLPERGYSEEYPYQLKTGQFSDMSRQLSAVLLSDIQVVGESLQKNPIKGVWPEVLNSRMLEIKYIRECAATIKALHDIGM